MLLSISVKVLTTSTDFKFLDSHLSYSGSSTTTLSGLGHLEGQSVSILADGSVHANKTVSSICAPRACGAGWSVVAVECSSLSGRRREGRRRGQGSRVKEGTRVWMYAKIRLWYFIINWSNSVDLSGEGSAIRSGCLFGFCRLYLFQWFIFSKFLEFIKSPSGNFTKSFRKTFRRKFNGFWFHPPPLWCGRLGHPVINGTAWGLRQPGSKLRELFFSAFNATQAVTLGCSGIGIFSD